MSLVRKDLCDRSDLHHEKAKPHKKVKSTEASPIIELLILAGEPIEENQTESTSPKCLGEATLNDERVPYRCNVVSSKQSCNHLLE